MSKRNLEQIREGLQHCLITRECITCPYYIWYYNDDINEPGDRSCWGILRRDADEALLRLEILTDTD